MKRLLFSLFIILVQTPACGSNENTIFAVIGDYGISRPSAVEVSKLVKSWKPDFVITVGDNNYPEGAAATIDSNVGKNYSEYIFPYSGKYQKSSIEMNRFFPVLGNHDWHTAGAKPYLDYFELPGNERYYVFQKGPIDFFAVDSDPHEPDGITSTSIQSDWLKDALEKSKNIWKIVYLHHPPYSSARHGSTPALQWPYQKWGATIVLAGHDHVYERLEVDGFPYIVNGMGGSSELYNFKGPIAGSKVRFNSKNGAVRVTASDTSITFDAITISGKKIDTFTIDRKP